MPLNDTNQTPTPGEEGNAAKRAPAWRAELNDNYCKLRKTELPPIGYGSDGKLKFADKPDRNSESYILWDISRDAPPGFGLKVAGKKTYILRRKVMGKSMLSKVGNFTDFAKIQDARAKAAELALTMVASQRSHRRTTASDYLANHAQGSRARIVVSRDSNPRC